MSEQHNSDQKMQDALQRTVRHVVETMCFAEVAPSELAASEQPWAKAETIVTAVNFYGSRSGRLQLEVSSSAAWSLRKAFLGTKEQDEAAGEAGELVGELGTMICGRFLSAVDPLSTLSLSTPETCAPAVREPELVRVKKTGAGLRQGFLLDSGHLTASVEFDREKGR